MKILVVSNFYPPHYLGGYELGCRDVVDGLIARGHDVRVLTSTYGVQKPVNDGPVWRWLPYHLPGEESSPFPRWSTIRDERAGLKALHRVLERFRPDILYVWNPGFISPICILGAERLGIPSCYYVFDHWLERGAATIAGYRATRRSESISAWLKAAAWKAILGVAGVGRDQGVLRPRNVQYASHYLQTLAHKANFHSDRERIVPFGIDPARFPPGTAQWPPTRYLYVGQVIEHKGVHTVIDAFVTASRRWPRAGMTLTVAGMALFPAYETRLRAQARDSGCEEQIRFIGAVPRAELPAIYARHDVLLFPPEWDEPFGITPLEAMASGLAVVTTATGGSGEFLIDGTTSLVFPRGDATACAERIGQLLSDRRLYETIRYNGGTRVTNDFNLSRVVPALEAGLREIVDTPAHPAGIRTS